MSRELRFYGASDDLFEIEGTSGSEPDEVGCYDTPCVAKVAAADGQLCVVAMYAPNNVSGCWSIGLMPVDEDVPIPSWPMQWKLRENHGYSTELTLTAPDDAVVSLE